MKQGLQSLVVASFVLAVAGVPAISAAQSASPSTPEEFVATYDSLATAILATKQTERNLVEAILSTTFAHANAARARAEGAIQSGDQQQAQAALEEVAGHVAQLANEGDNAVAAIRKRLVEGGHHHNAAGEKQGIYEPGFVIVTRSAKQKLLESSRTIAQLSRAPDKDALNQEWAKVNAIWEELSKTK